MDRRLTFTIIMIMVFHYTTPAFSSPHDCPKTLSMYAENALTLKARKIFETMYAKLGCSLNVRVLPPKRSILYFNRALIDGELYRLEDIEKKYTRTFVRSRFPLLSIPVSLWAAADKETYETRPLGYVKGYAWQERFVSKKPLLKTVGYMNENDLYLAFNKGIVGSFINNDPYVEFLQQDGILTVPVTKIMTVETRSFYHYLNAKYAPFMDRFSDLLAKEKNFNIFDKQQRLCKTCFPLHCTVLESITRYLVAGILSAAHILLKALKDDGLRLRHAETAVSMQIYKG